MPLATPSDSSTFISSPTTASFSSSAVQQVATPPRVAQTSDLASSIATTSPSTFVFVHDRNVNFMNSTSPSSPNRSLSPIRHFNSAWGDSSLSRSKSTSSRPSSSSSSISPASDRPLSAFASTSHSLSPRGVRSSFSFSSTAGFTHKMSLSDVSDEVRALCLTPDLGSRSSGSSSQSTSQTSSLGLSSKTVNPDISGLRAKTPSLSTSSSNTMSDSSDRLSLDSDAPSATTLVQNASAVASEDGDFDSRELALVPKVEDDVYSRPKSIEWFKILEDMGQGAYGQVKLAQYKPPRNQLSQTVVLKYVIKKRILVDTWIRDRKLGTLPLEIHVLKYLQNYRHANIVDMLDYFEDDINYYIEMAPHGIPGMDLFDYIELRTDMEESECKTIFFQVASAVHHLHKYGVVHRDIKDENIILDGEGRIKLIDFGSAAYIKNGPFSVFVGTIDYAAPEVLRGQSYSGKEQDVWAAGILLYTIMYKENPFYDSAEIMNSELKIPKVLSEGSLSLINRMLDRNVAARPTMDDIISDPWFDGCGIPSPASEKIEEV
ncbi:kinase-like domain-containing protein [Lipomyces oligophaga]|uniref:kinase-like domain-containing protein n=1 Tax=Lipomyces oligophaga TaxID=45792 RepID=UPI0034CE6463